MLSKIRRAQSITNWLKTGLMAFFFQSFTHPHLNLWVLLVASPILFPVIAALEMTSAVLSGLEWAYQGEDKDLKPDDKTDLRNNFIANSIQAGTIATAVVGAIKFAPVFTKPLVGAIGGMTPVLFTAAMGLGAAVGLGETLANVYRWSQAKDKGERSRLAKKARNSFAKTLMFTAAAVGVTLLLLNPVTAPATMIVGGVVGTVLMAHNVYTHRAQIAAGAKKLVGKISHGFAWLRQKLTNNAKHDVSFKTEASISSTAQIMFKNSDLSGQGNTNSPQDNSNSPQSDNISYNNISGPGMQHATTRADFEQTLEAGTSGNPKP